MLPAHLRLSRKEIKSLFDTKHAITRGSLCILHSEPALEASKVSVSVSKKVAKSAVLRNRIRRQWYRAVREVMKNFSSHQHVFIQVLPLARDAKYDVFLFDLTKTLTKARIL